MAQREQNLWNFFPLIIAIFAMLSVSAKSNPIITFNVDQTKNFQSIDGFGASDAWRCQFVGKNWPLEKREKIADWLFSSEVDENGNPQGIGLSIWRFYLAAGTTEQGEASGIPSPWRRGECFLSPEGKWDWTKYEGQRWFLNAAKKRGVPKFLAFTIAPPVQYAKNGKGYGTKGNSNFNIVPGKEKDYAAYLANVLQYFKLNEGIEFDYLSPFNEPQWDWERGSQEGTPAKNDELFRFVKCVSNELSWLKLKTQIVVGEAGKLDYLYKTVGKNEGRDNQMESFFSPTSSLYIGKLPNVAPIISSHSYFTIWPLTEQIESRKALAEKMQLVNPSVGYWQSEYCILEKNDEIGQGSKRDLGMATALFVARIIHNDLTICNARSWQWWTAITESDYKDGLVYLDSGNEKVSGEMGVKSKSLKFDGIARDSKLMWVLGNYSRFVRPGMVRIDVHSDNQQNLVDQSTDLQVSAYKDLSGKKTVLVFINYKEEGKIIELKGIKSTGKTCSIYVTNESDNLKKYSTVLNHILIPKRSVSTLVIEGNE